MLYIKDLAEVMHEHPQWRDGLEKLIDARLQVMAQQSAGVPAEGSDPMNSYASLTAVDKGPWFAAFDECSKDFLETLGKRAERRVYMPGQKLAVEGEKGEGCVAFVQLGVLTVW